MPNQHDTPSADGNRVGSAHPRAATRQDDQDRTMTAMHDLESALASAATGERTAAWTHQVLAALSTLSEAMRLEQVNAAQPDSLLSAVARTTPRLRHRTHGIQARYRQLAAAIAALSEDLERTPGEAIVVHDLRHRLGWLLTAIRYQRARESDVIYEALELDDEIGRP